VLQCLAESRNLPDDLDAHRARRALDGAHRRLEAGDAVMSVILSVAMSAHLLLGDLAHLLLARLVGARPLLLVGVQSGRLLEQHGRRRRAQGEREAAVGVDGDDDRDRSVASIGLRLGRAR
jgi:hypothetical protein